jgi:hypothetical protein
MEICANQESTLYTDVAELSGAEKKEAFTET